MRKLLFISLLVLSSISQADFAAPDATYSGHGQLVRLANGHEFNYDVTYVISGDSVTATYVYPSGFSYAIPFKHTPNHDHQFTVQIGGQITGSGYCFSSSCHVDTVYPLDGLEQRVSVEFTYVGPNVLLIAGRNFTSNTLWEDHLTAHLAKP